MANMSFNLSIFCFCVRLLSKEEIMAYTYTPSIANDKKVDRASVGLQICHMIYIITTLFSSTFLVSYIISVNANSPLSSSLVTIAIFYVSEYVVFGLCYFLISYVVDRTSRIWVYRASILFNGAFITLLIFLGKEIASYIILAGAMLGITESLYYASFNVLKGEMVPRRKMTSFSVLCLTLDKTVRVIFPIIMGLIIDLSNFFVVAFCALALVAIQFGFTFMIKAQKPEGSSFKLRDYIKRLKANTDDAKRIKRFYPICILYSSKTVFATLFTIITVYTFKTNLKLGLFTSLSSLVAVLSLFIFKRFTKEGKRFWFYFIPSLVLLASTILLVFDLQNWTYVIFSLVQAFSITIVAGGVDIERNTIVKKTGHYDDIAEHNCITEITLAVSRVAIYSLMLVLGLTLDMTGLKIMMIVAGVMIPVWAILLDRMERVECNYSMEDVCKCNKTEEKVGIQSEVAEN